MSNCIITQGEEAVYQGIHLQRVTMKVNKQTNDAFLHHGGDVS